MTDDGGVKAEDGTDHSSLARYVPTSTRTYAHAARTHAH